MAVPMGLTALALVWLSWRLGGQWFVVALLFIALGLLSQLTKIGWAQRLGREIRIWQWVSFLPLAILFQLLLPATIDPPHQAESSILPTQPYSETALASARASGKPVFLYFTADWCLTCKVNEAAAIEREETRAAFAKAGVVVLRGDWTRRDAAISRFLTEQGAAGVPLYLWYPKGGGAPQQLPQVLTPSLLAGLTPKP